MSTESQESATSSGLSDVAQDLKELQASQAAQESSIHDPGSNIDLGSDESVTEAEHDVDAQIDSAKQAGLKVDDNFVVELPNGQKVRLGDLKRGFMMQSDYTRKTQQLASERKAFEAQRDKVSKTLEEWNRLRHLVKKDEKARELLANLIGRVYTSDAPGIDEELETEQASAEEELDPWEGEYQQIVINNILDALQRQYGPLADPDRDAVLQKADEITDQLGDAWSKVGVRGILRQAYMEVMMPRLVARAKRETAQETAKKVAAGQAAKTLPGKATHATPVKPKKPLIGPNKMSDDEWREELKSSLGLK